jgi:ABC-type glycerol-3-phosphate transport system substrate-binding protein
MKKSIKKLLSVLLILTFGVSMLTACGSNKTDDVSNNVTESPADTTAPTTAPTAAPTVTEEPVVDLGGLEITIGDWWSPETPAEPTNQQEEDTLAYRTMIQEKYNFTMKQANIGEWGSYQELYTTSVMSGEPAAQIFLLDQRWLAQPLANGLFYDLSTLDCLDFSESKWNQSVINEMTAGNSIYGMAVGKPDPRGGVFWNKRLFQEAGLDPDLPYDLQKNNEWTWKKYEEICKTLTRDTNNDGTVDTYAMANFSADIFSSVLAGNDARYIGRDANGKFYNGALEPQFLEAVQWVIGLKTLGYEMPQPEGANWDWFISAFHDAKVAMTFAEQYKVGNWADMTDDWGFVLPPKPTADKPNSVYYFDNVVVIPSCYDAETAEKIAYAYNLWTNPTPGYEDQTDAWKDVYYPRFRDARAVDETLTMMYDPSTVINSDSIQLVYGTDRGPDFEWDVYGLSKTPAEKLDELTGKWQSLIDDANK